MKKDGNDTTDLNDTLEEVLRREIIELKKEVNALKSEIAVCRECIVQEVKEKYRAYEKLAQK
jgi:hypothetical protein